MRKYWMILPVVCLGCASDVPAKSTFEDGGTPRDDAAELDASRGADGEVSEQPDGSSQGPSCESGAGLDLDGDGFAYGEDCNDCDPAVNPAAFDVAGNQIDEDCSGAVDDEMYDCEGSLSASSEGAEEAARALGLCRKQQGQSWGLVSAKWVFPNGDATSTPNVFCQNRAFPPSELSHALLESFGTHNRPTDGKLLVALSSGLAEPGVHVVGPGWAPARGESPGAVTTCNMSTPPAGFPKNAPGCPPASDDPLIYDSVALELKIRVPANAVSLNFDFQFVSSEFPYGVCGGKSDHFIALLDSRHPATPADKNISFDSESNVVSVDSAFLQVCSPVTYRGRTYACPRGEEGLLGTGLLMEASGDEGLIYKVGGATGWLKTRAPVIPGETISIRFAIWDTDDTQLDSTVLLDNIHWTFLEAKPMAPPPDKPETDWALF